MPVSHLGLTVSHIPTATSFYLQALQPLGYHFIGESGDSIGLGVTEADLFLTQEPSGRSVSPTHIAFAADNRLTVRNCYAAALSAGAYPSGAPSYRNGECTVFNAAVEDLDGNVIEFVYREAVSLGEEEGTIAPTEDRRVTAWQKDVAASGLHDDLESITSRKSRAKSRTATAMDLASTTSKSVRSMSEAPSSRTITRSATMPASTSSDFPNKAFFGTILGAAAGAAIMFAMTKSEDDNAKEEAAFVTSTSTRSRSSTRAKSTTVKMADDLKSHRNYSVTESRVSRAPKSHRNFSVTESAYSKPQLPVPPRSMRAIDQAEYYDDDEVREAISRFASSRRPPAPKRSKTIDAIEYAPSSAGRSKTMGAIEYAPSRAGRSRYTAKRSATLPIEDPKYLLEAPKSIMSRLSSRRTRIEEEEDVDDQDLKRRDSGISMGSHRSRHGAEGSHVSRRTESTVKPSQSARSRHESAADVPLPASKAPTNVSEYRSRQMTDVSLPASKAPTQVSERRSRHTTDDASRASHCSSHRSRVDDDAGRSSHSTVKPLEQGSSAAADVPLPASKAPSQASRHTSATTAKPSRQGTTNYEAPSAVTIPASKAPSRASEHRSKHTSDPDRASHHSSRHSSASTLKPSKHGSSRYESAVEVPLPVSQAPSYVTAAQVPIPESNGGAWEDPEESDGLGDTRTVVPDDSISCVDFSKPRSSARSSHSHKSSRHHGSSSKRSEAAGSDRTVKAASRKEGSRHSAATLPVRSREEAYGTGKGGKKSTFSYT